MNSRKRTSKAYFMPKQAITGKKITPRTNLYDDNLQSLVIAKPVDPAIQQVKTKPKISQKSRAMKIMIFKRIRHINRSPLKGVFRIRAKVAPQF
jgi:hypothetical protein